MKVCVIGVGYVGLTTATVLAKLGHTVQCIDLDEDKIESLKKGILPVYEPGLNEMFKENMENMSFHTNLEKAVVESNILMITVGTPSAKDGRSDLSALNRVIDDIGNALVNYKTIVVKSTVPPGTNAGLKKRLLSTGIPYGSFNIVSNPEFLREGSALRDMLFPSKTVIGVSSEDTISEELMRQLYSSIDAPFVVTNLEEAEMIKYANNFFLATKISFINEMARICDGYGADINEISKAIGLDPRIGPSFLQSGIGYGGSCFPKDIDAMLHFTAEQGLNTQILSAVKKVNECQVDMYVEKMKSVFPDLSKKKITVLGISFKPNTTDIRNSPAIKVIERLVQIGCEVHAFDPVAKLPDFLKKEVKQHDQIRDAIKDADCLFLATEWQELLDLNWKEVRSLMQKPFIIDGRNILDLEKLKEAGMHVLGVGRNNIS
ncbi:MULTISPECIES: UDP-glucose/GDP-mannose dehydrogenase family protein [unclassified Bacillus (in: firmicutes)]|uniref:UDP-glucose dehydrogenase family protein n=1 Tax=unclassified Bacillus (in: firmicutes) TaxID=185979 RepID=UPI0008EA26F0|nr:MULTISPECIES: UDP-glucose/GDP-mannose dehydrogenase family protein [unclassified Bacillus (in: firmicutes)]SFA72006.1 UDPglucose 6-dehydrogenase [Bacillus sp. UNCCL13]SFQ62295.1 UDPglucose 6-dehydrogenase [Bacillus sp. cl95]